MSRESRSSGSRRCAAPRRSRWSSARRAARAGGARRRGRRGRPRRGQAALRRGGQHRLRAAGLPARGRRARQGARRQAVPDRRQHALPRPAVRTRSTTSPARSTTGSATRPSRRRSSSPTASTAARPCDVAIEGFKHFETVRIGSAAVHADAMVVVTHVKGHEATGFGGAIKNVGMGLGCRSAKQRMHADFTPEVTAEKCTACGRCVKWCPVNAIVIGPDRVAVRSTTRSATAAASASRAARTARSRMQWKTTPEALQEKIVEHVAGCRLRQGGQGRLPLLRHQRLARLRLLELLRRARRRRHRRARLDRHRRHRPGRLRPGGRGERASRRSRRGHGAAAPTSSREITGVDGTIAMRYAEEMGLGTRDYELRQLD